MNDSLARAWARQVAYCDANASPFTARVLDAAWADRSAGGALAALLPGWTGDAWADAVPLRVAGALHAMALSGADADLAAHYPPSRTAFDAQHGPGAIAAAIERHPDTLRDYLAVAPQTNEIGRSAVLLGGFACIVQATPLPLATLEIGASAGLNQLWYRYRYELGGLRWGDEASAVRIGSVWSGNAPSLPSRFDIASFAACDASPIDLAQPRAALRLASYVWADQRERLERLQAAITLAQRLNLQVERADALEWLTRELAAPLAGCITVLVHSIMWQYMPLATRAALEELIAAAGARATREAPLAWLAFEPPAADANPQLALTLWPGGERRILAEAHPHGRWVRWTDVAATAPGL